MSVSHLIYQLIQARILSKQYGYIDAPLSRTVVVRQTGVATTGGASPAGS